MAAPDGRIYYQNNITKKTQWTRPEPESIPLSTAGSEQLPSYDNVNEGGGEELPSYDIVQQSEGNIPVDVSPLPSGWEEKKAPDGRIYYQDHNTEKTQWNRPGTEKPLPSGWRKGKSPDGRIYYINDVTKQTQWNLPQEVEQKQQVQAFVQAQPQQVVIVQNNNPAMADPYDGPTGIRQYIEFHKNDNCAETWNIKSIQTQLNRQIKDLKYDFCCCGTTEYTNDFDKLRGHELVREYEGKLNMAFCGSSPQKANTLTNVMIDHLVIYNYGCAGCGKKCCGGFWSIIVVLIIIIVVVSQ